MPRTEKCRPGVLRFVLEPGFHRIQFMESDHINPIRAIDAIFVEMRVIEKHSPEIFGQQNIGIQVEPPSVILKPVEPDIHSRAFIEAASVLAEKIGLNADRPMFTDHVLSLFILVRRDHNHRVEVWVIMGKRYIQHVIKPDAGCDCFDSERF